MSIFAFDLQQRVIESQAQRAPPPSKPMSRRERAFAQKHQIFLLRNIDRVQHLRQRGDRLELKTRDESREGGYLKKGIDSMELILPSFECDSASME